MLALYIEHILLSKMSFEFKDTGIKLQIHSRLVEVEKQNLG